jgi:hypothetical protein
MNNHAAKPHLSPLLLPQPLCNNKVVAVVMLYFLTHPHSQHLPIINGHNSPSLLLLFTQTLPAKLWHEQNDYCPVSQPTENA